MSESLENISLKYITWTCNAPGTTKVSLDGAGDNLGGVVGVVDGDTWLEESSISEHWGLVGVGIDCDLPVPPNRRFLWIKR